MVGALVSCLIGDEVTSFTVGTLVTCLVGDMVTSGMQ